MKKTTDNEGEAFDENDATGAEKREFERLRKRVARKLHGFSSDYAELPLSGLMRESKVDRSRFPVPELLIFTLRNVMRWPWSGWEEKTRWTVYGSVDGEPLYFSLIANLVSSPCRVKYFVVRSANSPLPVFLWRRGGLFPTL